MTSIPLDFSGFQSSIPAVAEAMVAIGKATNAVGLPKDLVEYVKLRASQINGCAYCLQYHFNLARSVKADQAKLDLLSAWWEFETFTPAEKAALALTEALTTLADGEAVLHARDEAAEHFTPEQVANLIAIIATINAWNRYGVAFQFIPPKAR